MCGIVGYTGRKQAQSILTSCLSRLEYRGYDSCGIAVSGTDLKVFKDSIRVKALEKSAPRLGGKVGIGHTRWATHGEPSKVNAHPHCDCTGRFAVVHNGIIGNYYKLQQQLLGEGHIFKSETDSEILPHLIEKYFQGNLEEAVERALEDVEGSYAVIVLMCGSDTLVAARKDSPLIIGVGDGENFIASDVPAILDYTGRVIYLEDGDIAGISSEEVHVRNRGQAVSRNEHEISWSMSDAQKAGYDHFMLKEIREQPKVIRDTLAEYIASVESIADLSISGRPLEGILLLACGTSYHAALIGRYAIEELAHVPARVEIASEFN